MSENYFKAETVLTDEEADRRVKASVKFAIEKQRDMGIPVAKYDRKNGYIYIVDESGNNIVIRKITDRRRYSERCKHEKKT